MPRAAAPTRAPSKAVHATPRREASLSREPQTLGSKIRLLILDHTLFRLLSQRPDGRIAMAPVSRPAAGTFTNAAWCHFCTGGDKNPRSPGQGGAGRGAGRRGTVDQRPPAGLTETGVRNKEPGRFPYPRVQLLPDTPWEVRGVKRVVGELRQQSRAKGKDRREKLPEAAVSRGRNICTRR
ncbi:hypothetical protein SKAU_G00202160 [Synaphobranchus kaupii]|uniref:Uncharacterized protein n=1 Tax=Synaphobranchus kaupii TaxID=118154 RepID=A0A9Q1FG08_SYNKA|nr:hypothetical protein SKAU_G00202160 [Synaphobranchus kaupii]